VSADTPPDLRTLVFGSLETLTWGAAWMLSPAAPGFGCVGAAGAHVLLSAALHGESEDQEWRLDGDGAELTASPAGEAVRIAAAPGFDQLCRVRGRFVVDGTWYDVDCLGQRRARDEPLELDRLASLRDVSAWFEPADGLALTALRPRTARGHDADLITASVLDSEAPAAVADPRLSTTYTADGRPARAGLELWLAGDPDVAEGEDGDDGEAREYPRRAAGEALGVGVSSRLGELDVRAELFRWHTKELEGAGVYLLARRG
jgi:hypothetical protein